MSQRIQLFYAGCTVFYFPGGPKTLMILIVTEWIDLDIIILH